MHKPKIGIVMGTTRETRFGERPARWIYELATQRYDTMEFELIDLREYPLPFFEEAMPLAWAPAKNPAVQRWGKKVAGMDGFIIVTAEYNHGYPAVLKNALDSAYGEFNRKPVAFVGYGGVGAACAIEQLRLVAIELQMAPVRSAVHIAYSDFLPLMQGRTFIDFPHLEQAVIPMFDDLLWWTTALNKARSQG